MKKLLYLIIATITLIVPFGVHAEDDSIPEDLKNDGLTHYTIYNRDKNSRLYCNYNLAAVQTDEVLSDITVSEPNLILTKDGDDLICEFRSDDSDAGLMVTSMGYDEESFISPVKNEQSHNNRTHNYKSGGRFKIFYSPVTTARYIYFSLGGQSADHASAIVRIQVIPGTAAIGGNANNANIQDNNKTVKSAEKTLETTATKENNPNTADMNIVELSALLILLIAAVVISIRKIVKYN